MRISDVLRSKGSSAVVTVASAESVSRLLEVLAEHRIGAVVVSDDGEHLAGIVSERDVVRALAQRADVLAEPISAIMTSDVHTCTAQSSVEELAELMTEHRFRHVPVVKDDVLVGLVSIGDVVKSRIAQLQSERDHLVGYISQ